VKLHNVLVAPKSRLAGELTLEARAIVYPVCMKRRWTLLAFFTLVLCVLGLSGLNFQAKAQDPTPSDPPVVSDPSAPPTEDPMKPGPNEPPLEPAPTPPSEPVKPEPVQPEPVKPAPVKPEPVKPEPVKPAPKPAPVQPAPVKPKPSPVKPAPKPAPTEPTPAQPSTNTGVPTANYSLALSSSEQVLRNGEIITNPININYSLNPASIQKSKQLKALSSNLEARLVQIASQVYRTPANALWVWENKTWIARDQFGWAMDLNATRANLLKAILAGKTSSGMVLKVTRPKRTAADFYARGIRHFFGGGSSSFAGSPAFRAQNIVAGSQQLDERTIQPGETFDFNKNVKISKELGFVEGFIISNGTLEKDIGGGICQVSTTLFRAAYNSGLPIVQRNFHSYRVHYYDPPGFEATVFSPYKNLKFTNDTGSPLFLQVTWYLRSQRLEMNFYGPKPDRTVSVSKSFVFNVKPPAAPRLQADDRVPYGRTRQIDSPENGMDVNIYRTVTMNTGEVRKDRTFSRYVPWGAIYGAHPEDPRVAGFKRPVPLTPFDPSKPRVRLQPASGRTPASVKPAVKR
jgi:vancomycin resistance protein YoaR